MKFLCEKLLCDFYKTDAVSLAKALLGKLLVTDTGGEITAGIIAETEAYMGKTDRACHAFGGRRTARNESMYLPGGHAYVYLIYGMYYCLNVVAAEEDIPEAVLVRGIIPVLGMDTMISRRYTGKKASDVPARAANHLADGPGKLCRAMAIDKSMDALRLDGERIYVCDCGIKLAGEELASERINIDYAGEDARKLWRFTAPPDDPLRRDAAAQTYVLP